MAGAPPQSTLHFSIWGPIARDDLPGLCDRVCDLLAHSGGATVAYCDAHSVPTDAVTVDVLASLQLAARRRGCQVRLRGASAELRVLLGFMGLNDVIPK